MALRPISAALRPLSSRLTPQNHTLLLGLTLSLGATLSTHHTLAQPLAPQEEQQDTTQGAPQGGAAQEQFAPEVVVLKELSPRYPREALRAAVTGEVVLELLVDEEGRVMSGEPVRVTPQGYGFTKAALEALDSLRFEPIRVEGIAVQMSVTYMYRFTDEALRVAISRQDPSEARLVSQAEVQRERRGVSLYGAGPDATDVLGVSIHDHTQLAAASGEGRAVQRLPQVEGPTSSIEGRVLERGTARPVRDARVQIEGFAPTAITNEQGRFEFKGVPLGEVRVLVKREGYRDLMEQSSVTAKPLLSKMYLRVSSFVERSRGGSHLPPRVVTRSDLSQDEIRALAGVDGDPLEAARELAGAYRPPLDSGAAGSGSAGRRSFGEGGFAFRGTQGGGVYVLGSPLITPHHLGGYRSLTPSSLLGRVSLSPQYGLDQGRVGAGVLDLTLAQPSTDRLAGEVELTPYDVGATLGGPLTPHLTLTGAVRAQTMRLNLQALGAERALREGPQHPHGLDAHARLTYREQHNDVDALLSLYGDRYEAPSATPLPTEPSRRGGGGESQEGAHLHAQWRHHSPLRRFNNTLSLGLGQLTQRDERLIDERFEHTRSRLHLQDHLKMRLNNPLWLSVGLEQFAEWSALEQRGATAPVEGAGGPLTRSPRDLSSNNTVLTYNPALWVNLEGRWMRTHLVVGARANYFSDTEQYTAEPRLSLRYTPAIGTLLKLGGGLFTQRINPLALDPMIGNTNLKHERHTYLSAGLEQRFTRTLWLDMQGFYRLYADRLRPDTDPTVRLRSDGEGYSAGGEFTLRHDPVGRFYGWLAYTFAYTRVKDGAEGVLRRTDVDQSHKLSLLAGFKLTPDVSLNTRWRYWRGGAYSDLPNQLLDADRGQASFEPNLANDMRLSDGHELDLRLDAWWRFERWRLLSYLQVSNVYQNTRAELPHPLAGLNPNAPTLLEAWPLWVSAGLRAHF